MGRILALDYGSARCGVALSDPSGTIASPMPVVRKAATPSGVKRIAQLVAQHDVERVVLGLPIGLSGRETAQTKETRQFCETLRAAVPVPVDLYDERFTTKMAERDPGGRADEDSRAAAHLLTGWLGEHAGLPPVPEAFADRAWEDDGAVSLFGGGRGAPRERTPEERRQALIERERRRSGNPKWQPPAGHPLAGGTPQAATEAAPAPAPRRAPQQPAPTNGTPANGQAPRRASQPQPAPVDPLAESDPGSGWWDDQDLHFEPDAAAATASPPTAQPGEPAARQQPQPAAPQRPAAPQQPAKPQPAARQQPAAQPQQPVQPRVAAAPARPQGPAPTQRQAPTGDPAFRPRRPAPAPEPLVIEPEPPAQPIAQAYDLPDHREVALHRRRNFASRGTTRTVVSPPGDANRGGTLAPPSRRRRYILMVLFLFLAFIGWTQWSLWQPTKGSGTGTVTVKIPEGAGASEVGRRLANAGVIDSARLFTIRAIFAGQRDSLPSGTVTLKHEMSYGAALSELSGGNVGVPDLVTVTIPEGLSIREMAARFKRQNTVKDYGATAVKILRERKAELHAEYGVPTDARSLEGLLFPSTYQMQSGFTARDLIERQLQTFEQNIAGISMTKAKRANLTRYDVLTIASMIEREARITRERSLISAVIYNRLKAGMPLGIDATFRYANGNWTDPITQSQLQKDGPYNSRLRTGLPPTPIGNPGLASIEAAASPASVNYLYFVVKPGRCGEHAFAATAEKFEQDSAKYNAARDAAGKSPTAC